MKTLDELLKTHKQCGRCKEYKLFDSFNKCSSHKGGLHSHCRECDRESSREYHKKVYSDPDLHKKELLRHKERYKKNVKNPLWIIKRNDWSKKKLTTEDHRKKLSVQKENHPEKLKARDLIKHAIRKGYITRMPCEVCGNPKSETHHEDYSQPYNVTFLCRTHHMELHRKYDYE